MRLLEVVRAGLARGPQAGMDAERRALVDLAQTESTRSLMRIFFLRQAAKKNAYAKASASPASLASRAIGRAAVIGGGTMGAGIAYSLARAGIDVQVIEADQTAAASATNGLQNLWNMELTAGRMTSGDAHALIDRVRVSCDWTGIDQARIVIEAVPEQANLKREIFARLNHLANATAILATNTSSIDLDAIAQAVVDRSRVIGMHFFNPVPRMPLVEIVRSRATSNEALAAVVRLCEILGKIPVIAGNAPGFIINRLLMPYLAEATLLAEEGVSVAAIDSAMKEWGWPMGPFELMDEIGLDVTAAIMQVLADHFPQRIAVPRTLGKAVAIGWRGRKSGTGFYIHARQPRPIRSPNPAIVQVLATTPDHELDAQDIQWRLMLPMVNEAAPCSRKTSPIRRMTLIWPRFSAWASPSFAAA